MLNFTCECIRAHIVDIRLLPIVLVFNLIFFFTLKMLHFMSKGMFLFLNKNPAPSMFLLKGQLQRIVNLYCIIFSYLGILRFCIFLETQNLVPYL